VARGAGRRVYEGVLDQPEEVSGARVERGHQGVYSWGFRGAEM